MRRKKRGKKINDFVFFVQIPKSSKKVTRLYENERFVKCVVQRESPLSFFPVVTWSAVVSVHLHSGSVPCVDRESKEPSGSSSVNPD